MMETHNSNNCKKRSTRYVTFVLHKGVYLLEKDITERVADWTANPHTYHKQLLRPIDASRDYQINRTS